jgi:hypothetical protein
LFDCGGSGIYVLQYATDGDHWQPFVEDVDLDPTIVVAGAGAHQFEVVFADDAGINIETVDSHDIYVRGPGDFEAFARFVGVDIWENGTVRTATYAVDAPDGLWDETDNGLYSVFLMPDAVEDVSGNALTEQLLGTFSVRIATTYTQGDLNRDGIVDFQDVFRFGAAWVEYDPVADLFEFRRRDIIDFRDYAVLADNWLTTLE